MMLVQFVKPTPPYNSGERAGFPPEEAQRLVETGCAVVVTKAEPDPAEPDEPVVAEPKAKSSRVHK